MTNKFTAIAEYIKTTLKAAGFVSAYIYPDDKIGQNTPAIIIEEGSKTFTPNAGLVYEINHTVYIYILENKLTDRSKRMNDLEIAAWNALLADYYFGGLIKNINPMETDPGAALDNLDRMDQAGFRANCTVRKLTLNLYYCDTE